MKTKLQIRPGQTIKFNEHGYTGKIHTIHSDHLFLVDLKGKANQFDGSTLDLYCEVEVDNGKNFLDHKFYVDGEAFSIVEGAPGSGISAKELGDQPAYPTLYKDGELAVSCGGMTKREALAMAALNMWKIEEGDLEKIQAGHSAKHSVVAKFCIEVADAMIEELRKK